MSTFVFYIHTVSGDVATLSDWYSDYQSMDKESWHGKPIEECNPDNWVTDGKLEQIVLESDDECFLTDRLFPGWWGDTEEGEEYWSDWACYALDKDGVRYKIVWQFLQVKGEESEASDLPWDDESKIYGIECVS